MQNISNRIKKIVKQISKQKKPIKESTTLTNAILDSFNMLILIERLEKEFKIQLDEKDLHYTNFTNIKKISKLIKNKC